MPSPTTAIGPIDLASASETLVNLSVEELIAVAIADGDAVLAANGALAATTGKYTGRIAKDKYIVREPGSENKIWWDNVRSMEPELFARIRDLIGAHESGKKLYVVDTFGGADPKFRIPVRFVVERAWHALFVKQLLIRPTPEELTSFSPLWTIVAAGSLTLDAAALGTRSEAAVALNFAEKQVLIVGTRYAGEMKKSVFTILQYLLPLQGVLSMHCSANVGPGGDCALFFGLSGTGKTTLSAEADRTLIGDDEHGWSDDGVFNIEGGCYAKCINLSEESEPQIFNAIKRGTVLENVVLRTDGMPDFDDQSLTENTRAAYPIEFIDHALIPSVGGHPKNIVFLTCDAFGVLPPISKLTPEQAMDHFVAGYTAKVAGTEAGVTEPTATFSACFGAAFLPMHPKVYAELLGAKLRRHGSRVWLVNTGWTGGPYGVGSRMKLSLTRAMIHAAFDGKLDEVEFRTDPFFGLHVPVSCPGVPGEILDPRSTWADGAAYDAQAQKLVDMFAANRQKFA